MSARAVLAFETEVQDVARHVAKGGGVENHENDGFHR